MSEKVREVPQLAEATYKTSANKNAIFVFAFQTPQHFTYFGWTFTAKFFSGVYHLQDVRDEKSVWS